MPFADHGCLIVRFLKFLCQGPLSGVEPIPICPETVGVTVLSRQDRGPAGTADRITYEAVLKENSLGGNLVDIGRDIMFPMNWCILDL